MPPYFNLLLVISSCLIRLPGFFVQFEILYFLHQIGHGASTGFTAVFRHSCLLAAESVRTVFESQISEVGSCTFLTGGVSSPSPPKTGVRIRNVYLFPSSCYLSYGKIGLYCFTIRTRAARQSRSDPGRCRDYPETAEHRYCSYTY